MACIELWHASTYGIHVIRWHQLLILSVEFICWDQLLRSSAQVIWAQARRRGGRRWAVGEEARFLYNSRYLSFSLGRYPWELSFAIFRFANSLSDPSLENLSSDVVWELCHEVFRDKSFNVETQLWISFVWKPSSVICFRETCFLFEMFPSWSFKEKPSWYVEI